MPCLMKFSSIRPNLKAGRLKAVAGLSVLAAVLAVAPACTTPPAGGQTRQPEPGAAQAQPVTAPAVTTPAATAPGSPVPSVTDANFTDRFNKNLAQAVASPAALAGNANFEYRVGPGDILEINVFQVEELNLKVRVSGQGTIVVPLLGKVDVGGKTVEEIETLLARRLGAEYLQNPQVSVFIDEYRSQEVAVTGAVVRPEIMNIRRPRSIMEMLAMAGGLSDNAGYRVNVIASVPNAETGVLERQNLLVDLRSLSDTPELQQIRLQGGDSIHVPQAGSIYVEGEVEKPGVYSVQGEVDVLKAIAMAGGTTFEASESNVQIFRGSTGSTEVIDVNLSAARDDPNLDTALQDGDIVVVKSQPLVKGVITFWRGLREVLTLGATGRRL